MLALNKSKSFFSTERILLIIILLACFFSYFQIVNHDFIRWDDDKQITDNLFVKNLNWQSITHNLSSERYTFLTLTSYSVIYNLWGNNPLPFHCFSILLHLLNVLLIFLLTKKLSNSIYVTCLVALLFALHPMRVESVAWISEAKDLLFTFFTLCSFLVYIKYLKNDFKLKFLLLTALFALLASFSKIQGLLVPITLFLFDIYYKRQYSISLVLEKVFLFLLIFFIFNSLALKIIVVIVVLLLFFKNKIHKVSLNRNVKIALLASVIVPVCVFIAYYFINDKSGLWSKVPDNRYLFSLFDRFLLSGFALWFYLKSFFLPIFQNAVHPYPIVINAILPAIYYYTSIVILIVITISVYLFLRKKRISDLLFFGWFFFLINISMVLHLIPIEGRLVVADRYSYLAYFGLFIVLSELFVSFVSKKEYFNKIYIFTFTFLLILLSVLTYSRSLVWHDSKTLFNDVLQKNPNISFAYNNLGGVYLNERKPKESLYNFNKSINLDSLDPGAYFNRAMTYFMLDKPDSAISDFKNVLRLTKSNTDKALTFTNMGEIYHKAGNDSLALYFYNISINTDSLIAQSYNNRGMFYFQKNNFLNALSDFEKAISIDEYYADALNNRGWVLTKQNKFSEALKDFNEALKINPEYALAYNNRGFMKFSSGDISGAIADYSKAIGIDSSLNEAFLNRGWAYSSLKDYEKAVIDLSKVIQKYPRHQTAVTNRAFAFFYLKDYTKAGKDFEDALKYFPENAVSWQNIAWYHMQINDLDKSIIEFEKSVQIDSSLINTYLNLGWIYLQKKNFQKSEYVLNKAFAVDSKNPETVYWLGELNRQKGKDEIACKFFNEASILGSAQAKKALALYCKK